MVDSKPSDKEIPTITINAGTTIGSKFAQFASVSVSEFDVTLEFVYINPRDKSGQVISRITLPRPIGLDLANTILMTAKVNDKKVKGEQNG